MEHRLTLYNSIKKKKEQFIPLNSPNVGLYVCGPTVYGEPHLGHARPAITFDLLFRYLKYLGYKVRYVRNITDVGHLENDADEGEDKVGKKARLEQLEPMEVVQQYINAYNKSINELNVLPPSIEPRATGHIIEQAELTEKLRRKGLAYKGSDGSIYFDVDAYNTLQETKKTGIKYGILSGRNLDDIQENTRNLKGQSAKKNSYDFALWKKADERHIMKWSHMPFSNGFPGWHIECTAMSTKYLGKKFDIHGGGRDLLFPHHECEIAQGVAANGEIPANFWVHNNMITINGQKMGKSLGNFINLNEFFSGEHELLEKAYSPLTVRFSIIRAHYRSEIDFSNEALKSAESNLKKIFGAYKLLDNIKSSESSSFNLEPIIEKCFEALNDDLNTPIAIAQLFEAVKVIFSVNDGSLTITSQDLEKLKQFFNDVVIDILGLDPNLESFSNSSVENDLMQMIIQLRANAKTNKDFETADFIRDQLKAISITLKDTKDGTEWEKS